LSLRLTAAATSLGITAVLVAAATATAAGQAHIDIIGISS